MDDFEKRLGRQTLRQLPPDWREEILGAAKEARSRERGRSSGWQAERDSWQSVLQRLFWPHARAWAAMAGIWAIALVLNLNLREGATGTPAQYAAESKTPPSAPTMRQQLMAELRERPQPRPQPVPGKTGPRSAAESATSAT